MKVGYEDLASFKNIGFLYKNNPIIHFRYLNLNNKYIIKSI